MLTSVRKIYDSIQTIFTNENINKVSPIKIRQRADGLTPLDVLIYRFLYAHKEKTQEQSVALINDNLDANFTYQAYEKKDKNIPIDIYKQVYQSILSINNTHQENPLIAVDGINNNIDFKVNLNMGFFNISNKIPINIAHLGSNNRNGEVKSFKKIIQEDPDNFKNAIFVCDRLYFDYSLMEYLNNNNYHYIIRVKGNGNNLNKRIPLKKTVPKYDIINRLRDNVRVIENSFISYEKVEVGKRNKKRIKTIKKNNKCAYVTNLPVEYDDQFIFDSYKSRWDIEVFFKLIKNNFKFGSFIKDNTSQIEKGYICQLIIAQIISIIVKEVMLTVEEKDKVINKRNGKKVPCTITVNKTHLITRLYDDFIFKFFTGFTDDEFEKFIKESIKKTKNETGRSFPRIAKTPFKKWYLKGQSIGSQLKRICNAIIDGTVDKLNKNLRVIAKQIEIIK